jgi:hypothetical protein
MEAVMYGFAGGTRLTGPVVEGWLPALSQPFDSADDLPASTFFGTTCPRLQPSSVKHRCDVSLDGGTLAAALSETDLTQ